MSNFIPKHFLALLVGPVMCGCVLIDDTRNSGPDEFGVVSRAPLAQPPDFSLRPPRAGAVPRRASETSAAHRRACSRVPSLGRRLVAPDRDGPDVLPAAQGHRPHRALLPSDERAPSPARVAP